MLLLRNNNNKMEYTHKILDGCIKNEIVENKTITTIQIKLDDDLYAKVKITEIEYEQLGNITINEANIVVIDFDHTIKNIDINLIDEPMIHLLGVEDEYNLEEWCNLPGSEKLLNNYHKYISNVIYGSIIGLVTVIL